MNKETIANLKYKELFLPTLLIAMALNVAAVIDTMFIAQFIGESAVSAVELLEPIILIVTIVELLFGLGGQILSLDAKAEFDDEKSNKYFTIAVVGTFLFSLFLSAFFYFGRGPVGVFVHPPADVVTYLNQYTNIIFFVFPVSCTLGVLCEFIRIDGQPNFASMLLIIANLLNVVFDYVFIVYLHMGIAGPALATFIGYAVGLVLSLKYHFDSRRTYQYIISKLHIKESLKAVYDICRIGFPDASITVYEIIVVGIFNTILSINLGTVGLNAYMVCMDVLLISSIIIMGLIETFTTLVPVYYAQHDSRSIKFLYNKTIKYSLAFCIVFTIILVATPDLFLMLYNYQVSPNAPEYRHALRLFAATVIPSIFATIYLMYYESIERPIFSGILSAICMLIGPLLTVGALLPLMGANSIWLAFAVGNILTIIGAIVGVKIIERREPEYKGMLLFEKELVPLTENFSLYSKNDKSNILVYLKSLNVNETQCGDVGTIFDYLFDNNSNDTIVEALIINYDDKITVNIKDNGKSGFFEKIKKEISNPDALKSIGVLGFNNMEYVITK